MSFQVRIAVQARDKLSRHPKEWRQDYVRFDVDASSHDTAIQAVTVAIQRLMSSCDSSDDEED